MHSRFSACDFEDEGTAFIDAMQKRTSVFGVLLFKPSTGLSDANLRLLLQIDTMQHLGLPRLNSKLALLPFSARVDYLDYEISSSLLSEDNLRSLSIVTSELSITIHHDSETFPTDPVTSFLQCMADFSHLESMKLHFRVGYPCRRLPVPDCVVHDLIRVTLANGNLKTLELSDRDRYLDWVRRLRLFSSVSRTTKVFVL